VVVRACHRADEVEGVVEPVQIGLVLCPVRTRDLDEVRRFREGHEHHVETIGAARRAGAVEGLKATDRKVDVGPERAPLIDSAERIAEDLGAGRRAIGSRAVAVRGIHGRVHGSACRVVVEAEARELDVRVRIRQGRAGRIVVRIEGDDRCLGCRAGERTDQNEAGNLQMHPCH
jgi:hypothetical protein